ncbi:MAG: hypothetical protein J0I77_21360 [Rudaea sp.]|nr:hypothetical protein [Rudaea sp.]MBR0344037.1 hypothetical protein [Rudaea sp.]
MTVANPSASLIETNELGPSETAATNPRALAGATPFDRIAAAPDTGDTKTTGTPLNGAPSRSTTRTRSGCANAVLTRVCCASPPERTRRDGAFCAKLATTLQFAATGFVVNCVPLSVPPQVPPTLAE